MSPRAPAPALLAAAGVALAAAVVAGACSSGSQSPAAGGARTTTTAEPSFAGSGPAQETPGPVSTRVSVWFVDGDGNPAVVGRRVVGGDLARAAVLHLLAGPTPEEAAAGYRLERSGFEGVAAVRREGARVHVELAGPCDPEASGPTLADLIIRTLSPLEGVSAVWVHDGEGRATPVGDGPHAAPPCLAPAATAGR